MPGKDDFPRKGTKAWVLATGDWTGMTVEEIADVTGFEVGTVTSAIRNLKRQFNIKVDYVSRAPRTIEPVPSDLSSLSERSAIWQLIYQDWRAYTVAEIAKKLHKNQQSVISTISELERIHHITVKTKVPPQKAKHRKLNNKQCRKCYYWNCGVECCDYLCVAGHKRPCSGGQNCTEFKPRRSNQRGFSFGRE